MEGVAGTYTVEPANLSETQQLDTGRLVLITFNNGDMASELEKAWAAVAEGPMELKQT